MLCTVGWCLTAVLSIFSREVGSVDGGRLGASQVGSACCIWTSLPSGSLVDDGGRYVWRFSFGSWKVVALASSSYTGVRVAVWLSGLCEFLSASLVAYVQCCRLWQHPILLCGCSPFGLQPLVSIPSSSACLFALRLLLLQVMKLGFLMLSRLSPLFCSEGVVTNRCIVTLVRRLTRMTVQSPRLGEYRQCG
ncbi:hypothetical protein F2Q69_00022247 [Brassica cretica]|uniref:Secreted protein n=1 Tax=Brassica cretica TaxID=69181 RepID=A0A8S9Q3Y3_BRACR|nr:hypothetical protein F2Q69_00022247 [Brassica cretica]